MDAKLLDKGRGLARTLRQEGRREEAQTVDALVAAVAADAATPPLLTTGQVAQRLGVSRQTVVNWVRKGLLAGVRLGGRTLIRPAALQRFARLEGILDELDRQRPPLSADEAAETVGRERSGWTWRGG